MDKAIFSITCTTCHARLVVRSEAAIGAILECPRCESMVEIVPPPGWKPASEAIEQAPAAEGGPPPLDHVATAPQSFALEPTDSLLSALFGRAWVATGVIAAMLVIVAVALRTLTPKTAAPIAIPTTAAPRVIAEKESRPVPQPSPKAAQPPAQAATETKRSPAAEAESPKQSPPPTASPAPSLARSEKRAADPPPTDAAKAVPPKPAEPDPLPPTADEPAQPAAAVAQAKRMPPPQIDAAARLADPLSSIQLVDLSLAAAIETLGTLGSVPTTLNPDAMWQLGVTPQDKVSLQLDSTSIGKALDEAASQRGLAVVVEGGQVLITSPADYRESLRKVRYTVSDLTGDDKAAMADLAALVRRVVAPESWRAAGGRGAIEPDQGALVVMQTGEVHQQVLTFCERLRNARQKPLRSREKAERFTLTTHTDQARDLLDRPVSVNFHEPAPLARILAYLAETTGGVILVDRAALATAGTCDRVETSLTVQKQGLAPTLTGLLTPLGLAYRTVGPNLIQVTTPEALQELLEIEFYPVKAWLDRGVSPERLAERMKSRIAPSTWSDVGGQADVCFDPPSGCLIVLQSQPAQAAIQRLLASPPAK